MLTVMAYVSHEKMDKGFALQILYESVRLVLVLLFK